MGGWNEVEGIPLTNLLGFLGPLPEMTELSWRPHGDIYRRTCKYLQSAQYCLLLRRHYRLVHTKLSQQVYLERIQDLRRHQHHLIARRYSGPLTGNYGNFFQLGINLHRRLFGRSHISCSFTDLRARVEYRAQTERKDGMFSTLLS